MSNNTQPVLCSNPAEKVSLITLNRPQQRNALTNDVLRAIGDHLHNDEARCFVITGNDRVFAAGADLKELAAMNATDCHRDERPALWRRIADSPKPVIAAVNGLALGAGCELVLHTDIVITGESTRLGQPEINLGMIPGAGGTQRLIRAVGKSRAMQMVMTGEMISGRQAVEFGLASEVVIDPLVVDRAVELASRIAAKPPLAIRQARQVLQAAYETHLREGMELERRAFCLLADTDDRNEGITAFFEKRPARFEGT